MPLLFANIFGVSDFSPTQSAVASASVRDIALVLDRSGSMNARENGISRMQALRTAVAEFIDEIQQSSPTSLISLTTYATTAGRDIALTDNFSSIESAVNGLPVRGATNIFQGLRLGSDSLLENQGGRAFSDKTIVLMTDGNFNVGGTPIPSANFAAGRGHIIHTITFSSGANQAIMQQVADIGGGQHIHADDAGDLSEAFREIARALSVQLTQ